MPNHKTKYPFDVHSFHFVFIIIIGDVHLARLPSANVFKIAFQPSRNNRRTRTQMHTHIQICYCIREIRVENR